MFSWIRRCLSEKNVRMLYKLLGMAIPKDMQDTMVKSGALFFDHLIRAKPNVYEVKHMHTSLGLLETGLKKKYEATELEVGKFTGEGLTAAFDDNAIDAFREEI